jgi:molybdopterin-biosynthesis enzyme MoeA-like protein
MNLHATLFLKTLVMHRGYPIYDRMTVNDELERMWKEIAVVCFLRILVAVADAKEVRKISDDRLWA